MKPWQTLVRSCILPILLAGLALLARSGSQSTVKAQQPGVIPPGAEIRLTQSAPNLALITKEEQARIIRQAMANLWIYAQDPLPAPPAPLRVEATNGVIAFSDADGHLNLINQDGSGQVSLVADLTNISDAVWSPDNAIIAFVADAQGGRGLYTLRLADRFRVTVATGYSALYEPRWSPDAQHLTFDGTRPVDTAMRSFLVSAAGGVVSELAPSLLEVRQPSWLDNTTVVLAAKSASNAWNIYRVPATAPGQATPLMPANLSCLDACPCAENSVLATYPIISPDGTQIAFMGGRTEGDKNSCTAYFGLYLVSPAGGTPRKLADVADSSGTGTASVWTMRWKPDSSLLGLLAGGSDQVLRLTTVGLDGTLNTLHGREGGGWTGWAWSPDGTRMAAGFVPPSNPQEVDIVDPAANAFSTIVAGGAPAWSSRPPAPTVDLIGTGLEVTQAVQRDTAPYVPAVEKKTTWVRFLVKSAAGDVDNVTAVLHLSKDGQTKDVWPATRTIKVQANGGSHDQLQDTFNFEMPADWTVGTVSMRGEVAPDLQFPENDRANNVFPRAAEPARTVTFEPVQRITIYSYRYRFTDPDNTQHEPAKADIDATMRYTRWTYPEPEAGFTLQDRGYVDVYTKDYNLHALDEWARLLSLMACPAPAGGPDRCIGWIPSAVQPVPNDYWGYGSKDARAAINTVGYGSLTAHELGHAYGLGHSGCAKIGNYGFHGDETAQKVYPPNIYFNFMNPNTSCGMLRETQWISADNFTAIEHAILPNPAAQPARLSAQVQPYLTVSGVITPALDARVVSLYTAERSVGFDDAPGSGPYRIELQDAGGAVLFVRNFDGSSPDGPAAGAALAFQQTLPRPASTAQIVIWGGSTRLWTSSVPVGTLQVQITTPLDGLTLAAPLAIHWALTGASDPWLRYHVEFSPDAGTTWRLLAVNLTEPVFMLDPAYLEATDQGRIRIGVSDGLITASAVADGAFHIPASPPRVTILSPAANARVLPHTVVNLIGNAYDQAGVPVPDGALAWTLDGTTQVGSGNPVSVEALPYGSHTITLTATDAHGAAAAVQVQILVSDYLQAVYLPSVTR